MDIFKILYGSILNITKNVCTGRVRLRFRQRHADICWQVVVSEEYRAYAKLSPARRGDEDSI